MTVFPSQLTEAALELTNQNQIRCHGDWTLEGLHSVELQLEKFPWPTVPTIIFEGSTLQTMDTAGAWLLFRTRNALEKNGKIVIWSNFRHEHADLLQMITHYAPEIGPLPSPPTRQLLETIGIKAAHSFRQLVNFFAFVGETFVVLLRIIRSPSHLRWQALFANLHSAGLTALPIIGLMAFLMGIVLAYQGGTQLNRYGANIFIVDLVGITLLRELAPLLTAIIIAGRSGSAYTAQIGTMRVTEEIDALHTLGIAPMELLVLPKLLALIILMPLLSVYADILGLFGAMLIAQFSLGVNMTDFLDRLPQAVSLNHYLMGLSKAPIFAIIIALIGCYQGFQVTGGAEQVGKQVTISVVQAIFLVIMIDALFSILLSWLNI